LTLLIGAIVATGCTSDEHEHGSHDHDHASADELPGQAVTVWTDKTELFMEYRPLIVGQESGFACHFHRDSGLQGRHRGQRNRRGGSR